MTEHPQDNAGAELQDAGAGVPPHPDGRPAAPAPEPELELEDAGAPVEGPAPDALELERRVGVLTATVDQHSAELDAHNVLILALAFAFGALAGLIYLQARSLAELSDAFAG